MTMRSVLFKIYDKGNMLRRNVGIRVPIDAASYTWRMEFLIFCWPCIVIYPWYIRVYPWYIRVYPWYIRVYPYHKNQQDALFPFNLFQ